MKILFVNACMRGKDSRTLQLCREFLKELTDGLPGAEIIEHDLRTMGLKSVDQTVLDVKEPLCDRQAWEHPLFAPVLDFQSADAVVIGAPYWDMSFPSVLKVWVENMYVRNLTFKYVNDQSVGLCRGRESAYITTAGSPIGEHDWGAGYMRAVLNTLGIPGFTRVSAEALDLKSSDCDAIMRGAMDDVRCEARAMAQRLRDGR